MDGIFLSNQDRALVERSSLRKRCLSASVGLTWAVTPAIAYANTGNIASLPPPAFSANSHTGFIPRTSNTISPRQAGNPAWSKSHSPILSLHSSSAGLPQDTLDLASTSTLYSLSALGNLSTLTIDVGGKSEVINQTTSLTGSELVAAEQVLGGGRQTLTINSGGVATGGSFTLNSNLLSRIDGVMGSLDGLTVAHDVHMTDALSNLQLSGDLTNQGSIVVRPTASSDSVIHAGDIINSEGASITSPISGKQTTDLTLIADQNLVNNGSIVSSGNVNVTANSLVNAPVNHSGGLITAANNINVDAPTVTNAGTLKAEAGNINFNNSSSISIENTGGTISAASGAVNVRDASYTGAGNITINGGNILSNQLNLDSGSGTVNVDADNISGVVNAEAAAAHILASAPDLQLGTLDITGDPTYFNQGNITITGAVLPTNGADLAIVASGNILSDGGSLTTIKTNGVAGDVTLIAGANFSANPVLLSGSNDMSTTLTLTNGPGSGGGSLTGGLIDLTGGHGGGAPIAGINTSSQQSSSTSGSVEMVAFAGSGSGTGTVAIPQSVTINTSGNPGLVNGGSVTIIAGATKGTAISIGNINAGTSIGAIGGNVLLNVSAPVISSPVTILNGQLTGSINTSPTVSGAGITIGNITTNSGSVGIDCGGSVTFKNIDTSGYGGPGGGISDGSTGGAGGQVLVGAGGSISGQNIYAYGGGGGGGSVQVATNNGTNGGAGGSGSDVLLGAKSSIILTGMINTSGGGGGGGGGASSLATNGSNGNGGVGGAAGDVILVATKSVSVAGGIFSADGAVGGDGAPVSGTTGGSGGGGGGSYGGGGGGGAGGNDNTSGEQGGGGGGGLFGGGGGSGFSAPNNTPSAGGQGGGYGQGGQGGNGSQISSFGLPGQKFTGGAAANSGATGGALGFGGAGGSGQGPGQGSSGLNVINNGAITGGTLSITDTTGIGTAKAPITTLVENLNLNATGSSAPDFYINNLAGVNLSNFFIAGQATIQVEAAGNITTSTGSFGCGNLILTTAPGSNGSITLNGDTLTTNATLTADGTGNVLTGVAGDIETIKNLVITTPAGSITSVIGGQPFSGLINASVSLNAGGTISFNCFDSNLILQKSSAATGDVDVTDQGTLTVVGAVSAPGPGGSSNLQGNNGIILQANVTGQNSISLTTTANGNIVEKGVSENNPSVLVELDNGSVGTASSPFKTNASTFTIVGVAVGPKTSVYVNDTETAPVLVQSTNNPGQNLSVTGVSSKLTVAIGQFLDSTVKDTATGSTVNLFGLSNTGKVNVTAPNLAIDAVANANVQVTGSTTLLLSTVGGTLELSATKTITQEEALTVASSAFITCSNYLQSSSSSNLNVGSVLELITTGSGLAVDFEGSSVTATNLIVNTAVGATAQFGGNPLTNVFFGQTVAIRTSNLIVDGALEQSTSLKIIGVGTKNLSIGGTGDLDNHGTNVPLVLLTSNANLTISPTLFFGPFINNNPSNLPLTLDISVKGTVSLPDNTIAVTTNALNGGGTIIIDAGAIVAPPGVLAFNADGLLGMSGNGGSISINITGKQNISFETNGNSWTASAISGTAGGNGGNISVTTLGPLFVDINNGAILNGPQAAPGNGGNISLVSGSNLQITGTLNTIGIGTGTNGAIVLSANGAKPFTIDPANVFSNGILGAVVGGNVTITNPSGINVDSTGQVSSSFSFLQLTASEVTNAGNILGTSTQFTITNPTGNLAVSGNGFWGPSFAITFSASGNLNLGSLSSVPGASAIEVTLSAGKTLTLGTSTIAVQEFAAILGGEISITAGSLAYSMPTPALTLDAEGNTIGGTVYLDITGKSTLTLGTAPGDVLVEIQPVNATPVGGGTATIESGGNLIVNPGGLITNPSAIGNVGTTLTLAAGTGGKGMLEVPGFTEATVGVGGSFTASSNSATAFTIGSGAVNGINTSSQIVGQSLSVTNTGGGVFIGGSDFLEGAVSASVSALKSISGPNGTELIEAPTINLTSTGGSIGTLGTGAVPVTIVCATLSANAPTGTVNINNSNVVLTINASSAKSFLVQSQKGIVIAGVINAPTITIESGTTNNPNGIALENTIGTGTGPVMLLTGQNGVTFGPITQFGGTINATALTLEGTEIQLPSVNATLISQPSVIPASSPLSYLSVDNIGLKTLTIGTLDAAGGNLLTITSSGPITTNGTVSVPQATFNAGGAITVGAPINVATLALNAGNGGAITESKDGSITATSLSLTSDTGNIGGKGGLTFMASTLSVGTSGTVTLIDTESSASLSVGSIVLPVKSFSLTANSLGTASSDNLLLNSIATSNGSVTVVCNANDLFVDGTSVISTTNGSVTLQNLNTTPGPLMQVELGQNVTIHASGTAAGVGQVSLLVGDTPKSFTPGNEPSNISFLTTGKGEIFYGPGTTLSASFPVNQLNALGRNINFNGPGASAQISLDGGDIITADPPAASPAVTLLAAPAPTVASSLSSSYVSNPVYTPAAAPTLSQTISASAIVGGVGQSLPGVLTSIEESILTLTNSGSPFINSLNAPSSASTSNQSVSRSRTIMGGISQQQARDGKDRDIRFGLRKALNNYELACKRLDKGALLLSPERSTVVETPFGSVFLQRQTCVFLIASELGLTVFDLDDQNSQAVSVLVGRHTLNLMPGRHLTVSRLETQEFADVNPALNIGHREVRSYALDDSRVFTSEFRIMSALQGVPALLTLTQSADSEKKKLTGRLMKTMAVLESLSNGSTPYEIHAPATLTAMGQ